MRTFLLPPNFSPGEKLRLESEQFHYLRRVLRMRRGDQISGTDIHGSRHLLEVTEIREGEMILEPLGDPESLAAGGRAAEGESHSARGAREELPPSYRGPRIHLFQAVLKGRKMDELIRQAVEAGVSRISPVVSEHTVPRYEGGREEKKRQRWQKILREAIQQSGSSVITEVDEPIDISRVPALWQESGPGRGGEETAALFFHQHPLEQSSLHGYLSHYPRKVALVIGPEGGFSEAEVELLSSSGFAQVYLQTNILRAETAAIYAVAAVQTILMERKFWRMREEGSEYTS